MVIGEQTNWRTRAQKISCESMLVLCMLYHVWILNLKNLQLFYMVEFLILLLYDDYSFMIFP